MKNQGRDRLSKTRLVVIAGILGAVAFGGLLAYIAWTQDTFPSQTRPFKDYATVVSTSFNGTEYAFRIKWLNSNFQPYSAQLTADQDAGNTVVCGFGSGQVASGQVIFMPFGLPAPAPALTNVHLYVAVRSAGGGGDFTIAYNVTSISAPNPPADIQPSNFVCEQPAGGM